MSLSFSDKEHKILQDVCECSDANGYVLTWPVGCPGSLKFKMVTGYGEEGATLYLKIMDRVRETTEGSGNILQDQRVRLKRTTDNIYIIDKVERKRRPLTSQHRIRTDWKQLTLEALCHKRTVAPPTHLYIRGHAKFEGGKLATLHTQRSRKKAMKSREFTSSHSVGKEFISELLRTVAYIATRKCKGTVNFDLLQADLSLPTANNNVLQEIGRDMYSYIERRARTLIYKQ